MLLKLDHPRVWRTYCGSGLLDRWSGSSLGKMGEHYPEEWVASVVEARNPGQPDGQGLSGVLGTGMTLKEYICSQGKRLLGEKRVKRYGCEMGVLVKLIDAGERLTVQVHPDRARARRLFGSPYGKTECWCFLENPFEKTVEKPYVYCGFKDGITRKRWIELFERQDCQGMLDCLHRVEVSPGDVILIPGGLPHAIGKGCFLAEVQEPTDYTIRVERVTPSGYPVADEMCHQGIGFEQMFDCFDYRGMGLPEVLRECFLQRYVIRREEGGIEESLADGERISSFSMNRLTVFAGAEMALEVGDDFLILLVTAGKGTVRDGDGEISYGRGAQMFAAAGTGKVLFLAEEETQVLCVRGPKL